MLRRAVAVVVALVALTAGVLVGAAPWATAATAATVPAASTPAASMDDPAGAVVLVGTGGISWSDVDETTTPNLWVLLRDGASAALVARSVNSNTCPIDGWLGVSSGSRASAERTGDADNPANRPCPPPPTVTPEGAVSTWSEYVSAAADRRFVADLGLLGDTAAAGELCVRAVDPFAAVGGATAAGSVEQYSTWSPDTLL